MQKLGRIYIKYDLRTILQYGLVILAILQCNTVFFREYGTAHKKIVIILFIITLLALFGVSIVESVKRKINLKPLLVFLLAFIGLLITFLTISYIRRQYSIISVSAMFIPFFLVPSIYIDGYNGQIDEIMQKYKNTVVILAILSLIFWGLASIGLHPSGTKVVNWGSINSVSSYYSLHYIAQGKISFLGISNVIRNTGLFVEAPMYSYVLSTALLVSMFVGKGTENGFSWKTWVLMITIMTTTSSTGVIILILAVFLKLAILNDRVHFSIKLLLCILLIPVLVLLILHVINEKVDMNWYSSSSIRLNDFIAGYAAWKIHPWFGNGFDNYNVLTNNMDYRRIITNYNTGFSTGFMEILAYGGILGGMYYLLPSIFLFFKNKKLFVFSLIFFLLFVFTLVNGVYIYYIFISYFWAVLFIKTNERGN